MSQRKDDKRWPLHHKIMKMIKRKSINATSTCIFVVENNFNIEAYFSAPYFIAFYCSVRWKKTQSNLILILKITVHEKLVWKYSSKSIGLNGVIANWLYWPICRRIFKKPHRIIILCMWHLLSVNIHSSFVVRVFLKINIDTKMRWFFFLKNTNVFFTDRWVKKSTPYLTLSCLGIIILAILTAVFQAESHSTQLFLHTHVTSETPCIVLPLIWLKVRYEVVQKLDYQTCR